MPEDIYWTDAQSYFDRATARMNEGDTASLFYAAYEVRCLVEARQQRYLEAQEQYRDSLPDGWRIGQQWKQLNKIFQQRQSQVITCVFPDGVSFQATYVPVTEALRKGVESLGGLLHSQANEIGNEKAIEIRLQIEAVLSEAQICLTGNMLSPVLIDRNAEQPMGAMQFEVTPDIQDYMGKLGKDARFSINVDYFDIDSL